MPLLASMLGAIAIFHSEISRAGEFSAADVMKWDRKAQDFFIQTSVTMIGVVMTQARREYASCVDRWYAASDEKVRMGRHDQVLEVMRQYPDYHPQAVILAVVKKQCGALK